MCPEFPIGSSLDEALRAFKNGQLQLLCMPKVYTFFEVRCAKETEHTYESSVISLLTHLVVSYVYHQCRNEYTMSQ